MKNVILALTLLLPQLSLAAPSGRDVLISGIEELRVSPFLLSYNSGMLTLDKANNKITLAVHQNTCLGGQGNGRSCDILNQTVFVYEIVATGESCGSGVYTGQQISGGFLQSQSTITVVDHSTRRCRDLPPHRTEINQQITGRGRVIENYFGGSQLAPPFER